MKRVHIVTDMREAMSCAREHAHKAEIVGDQTFLEESRMYSGIRLRKGDDEVHYISCYDIERIMGLEYDAWTVSTKASPLLSPEQVNFLNSHKRGRFQDTNHYEDVVKQEIRIPTTYPGVPKQQFVKVALPTTFSPLTEYGSMPHALYEFDRVEVKVEVVYKLKGIEV